MAIARSGARARRPRLRVGRGAIVGARACHRRDLARGRRTRRRTFAPVRGTPTGRIAVAARDQVEELLAREQRVAVDPRLAAGPALDVRRREQVLPHAAGGDRERQRGVRRELELAQRADDELDRALDQRAAVARVAQNASHRRSAAQRRLDVVVVARGRSSAMRCTSRGSGSGDTNSRHSFAMTNSAVCGCARMTSSTASPSKRPVRPSTVLLPKSCSDRAEQVLAGLAVEAPAGERARRFLDVAARCSGLRRA